MKRYALGTTELADDDEDGYTVAGCIAAADWQTILDLADHGDQDALEAKGRLTTEQLASVEDGYTPMSLLFPDQQS